MAGGETTGRRPPVVPLFVLGFLACVALRSTGVVPAAALGAVSQVQAAALAAALFGMGASVQVRALCRGTGRLLVVSAASTLLVVGLALVASWSCSEGRGHPGGMT